MPGGIIRQSFDDTNNAQEIELADGPVIDALGRLRTSGSNLIESLHFVNSSHPLLVNRTTSGSATIASNFATSSIRLSATTSSADSAIIQTKKYFRYQPGHSSLVTFSGVGIVPKNNVRVRGGYFDDRNGLFFECTSAGLFVVVRTDQSGSVVDTRTVQSSWNLDKLDGTGPSGITLDPSKHNLYVIDFVWHGAGRIRFGILYNGKIVYCHSINGANTQAYPFTRTPSLPMRAELTNTGTAASGTTFDIVCFAFAQEATDDVQAPYIFTASTANNPTSVGNTIIPLLAIRPKTTFNGATNRIPIFPNSIQVAANQNLIYVVIYLNPTLTGASFASADSNSAVEFDTAATAVSGGTKLKEFYVPASSSIIAASSASFSGQLDLISLGLDIAGSVQDTLVIAARSTGGGTNTWAQIDWKEFQ